MGPVLLSITTDVIGDDVKTKHTRLMLVIAVLIALLVSACGVTRGEEERGFHRLRMMVPNSPGGGYDLTARTAVKIMEEDDITGRIEVFNVIGAGGTVAMARLMNEKGNDDLMMTMGLGVVGATYTNGSKIKASDATAIAKLIEDPGAIFVPADSPFKTVQGLRGGVEGRSVEGHDRRRIVSRRARSPVPDGTRQSGWRRTEERQLRHL